MVDGGSMEQKHTNRSQPSKEKDQPFRAITRRRVVSRHRSKSDAVNAAQYDGEVVTYNRDGKIASRSKVEANIDSSRRAARPVASQIQASEPRGWAAIEKLIGTVDGPADFASETDHYVYGTPKRGE